MSSLTITTPQAAQAPISTVTTSTTPVSTPTLVNGASIAPAGAGNFFTASADEILFTVSKVGTLTGDCYLELQVTVASGVVEVLKTYANALIAVGFADVVKLGLGTQFRWQIRVGTMTGANGVAVRFKN